MYRLPSPRPHVLAALLLALPACGDSSEQNTSGSDSGTSQGSVTITATAGSDSDSGASLSGSDSDSSASTTAGTSGGTTADTTAGPGTSDTGTLTDGPKFDVGEMPDVGEQVDCECGNAGFSYIWIANSHESTVTKLNTETMAEEGRYLTRADANGDPSRTSVTISGRAVAVANRNGGVVKIWASEEFCDPDINGQPGVQTSTGMNDVLPWGQDDCVAWYSDMGHQRQRPVAWTAGVLNQISCEYEDEKLWTSGCSGAEDITVHLLDGATGDIEESVTIPGFECGSYGAYGGAVDSQGNFWASSLTIPTSHLARVDFATMEVKLYEAPYAGYGITVDSLDRPWMASWTGNGNVTAMRFDPELEIFELATNFVANSMSGIQEDAEGRMWMNYWTHSAGGVTLRGLTYVDRDTLQVGPPIEITDAEVRGLSIDFDGNVWSTARFANTAYRYNPTTQQLDTYSLLNGPYTYSDMTGWALQTAECGIPQG
ncbi:MAG: hypothetical protein KC468_12900 [Myxococcales bacterium]|nr:hypothetical protein [Myxococcales bacterium]